MTTSTTNIVMIVKLTFKLCGPLASYMFWLDMASSEVRPEPRSGHVTVAWDKFALVWGGYTRNEVNENI